MPGDRIDRGFCRDHDLNRVGINRGQRADAGNLRQLHVEHLLPPDERGRGGPAAGSLAIGIVSLGGDTERLDCGVIAVEQVETFAELGPW